MITTIDYIYTLGCIKPDTTDTHLKNMIKSRKSILSFYVVIIFATCFFFGLGALMIKLYLDSLSDGKNGIFMILFAILLFFLGIYSPYIYFKRTYNISFDDKKLIFKSAFDYFELSWNDIENIRITGKVYFKYIFPFPMEGILINTKDKEINLYDMFLSKSHKIKYALDTFYKEKMFPSDFEDKKISANNLRFEKYTLYKGNPVFSFRGLMIWGLVIFFIILVIISPSKSDKGWIALAIIGGLWVILNSIFTNYYGLSDRYLVIRNHYRPWKNKVYDLSNIKEVVYESPDKWPNSLRVITKKYKSNIYGGGTLRDNTWRDMKKHFEKKDIIVRDECVF